MSQRAIATLGKVRRMFNWSFILCWFVAFPVIVAAEVAAVLWAVGALG